jgi:small-conductance mechanosensitive channel
MDAGLSTIRNLLYVVIVLVLLSALSGFYVATELARNSDELASLRLLLQKEMLGPALIHAQELEKQMDALNQSAAGIDDKLKKAQDDFVVRMQVELPRIMDKYVNERRSLVEQKIQQRGVSLPPH